MTPDTPPPKTALTICGSLRKDSINEHLRRHMSAKLREAGVIVTDLDLREFDMPIFNQDIEDAGETPEAAKRLAEMFRSHDIVLIISPEYNGGVTPLIANLISWVSREKPNPFKHAVFGIGGLSDGKYATVFALSHLRDSLSKIGALVVVEEAKAAGFTAPEGFEELDRRAYDDTEFVVLRAG